MPQLLFLFADFGLNQGIVRYAASLRVKGENDRVRKIVKCGLLFKAFIGITIFVVNFVFADWFASLFLQRPDMTFYLRLASTGILFHVIFTTVISAFVGLDRTEYNAVATSIQAVSKTIIQIALLFVGSSVTGALIGNVASFVVGSSAGISILFLIVREKEESKSGSEILKDVKTLVRYGALLYVSSLLIGFIPVYQNVIARAICPESNDSKSGIYRFHILTLF
jgi:O-antigen/teichoic acid export membrane protein